MFWAVSHEPPAGKPVEKDQLGRIFNTVLRILHLEDDPRDAGARSDNGLDERRYYRVAGDSRF